MCVSILTTRKYIWWRILCVLKINCGLKHLVYTILLSCQRLFRDFNLTPYPTPEMPHICLLYPLLSPIWVLSSPLGLLAGLEDKKCSISKEARCALILSPERRDVTIYSISFIFNSTYSVWFNIHRLGRLPLAAFSKGIMIFGAEDQGFVRVR